MFKLKNYLKKYLGLIITGPFFKMLEAVGDLFIPLFMADIIDIGIANNDKVYIIKLAIVILAINLVQIAVALISQKCASKTCKGVGRSIRQDMFMHINSLSHNELDKFETTTLVNRSVHDVFQIETAIGMTLRLITRAPLLLVGSIVLAMIIDLKLSLIFVVVLPLILFSVLWVMKKSSPLYVKTKTKLDSLTSITRDNLGGIRVVRAFNKQTAETKRFDKANKELTDVNIEVIKIASILQPLLFTIINFGVIAILYFGSIQVNIGEVSQGSIIAFINYFAQISMALVVVARIIITFTKTSASIKRVKEVFEIKNSITDCANPVSLSCDSPANIEFENVSFSYNDTKETIKNFSLKINDGETIGIIGGTGSGKSTIISLLPRFYDVKKGKILINGINIKRYKLEDLRNFIGIVPQSNMLFEGTLKNNLLWRKEDATEEDIVKALKIAQAYEFVKEKPMYLATRVNRGGTNFSGGQRQRLCIARALVGSPKVLILDDSSSALDFTTDANLRKAIKTMLKQSTVILVSQRVNTIRYANKIVVVDNGDIVGIDTHENLLESCQVYKEIYNSQNKRGVK